MTNGITIPTDLSDVDKAIFLVKLTDKATSYTRELLYKIFADKSYEERFTSWDEFVESADGLNKSRGWASKNLSVYKHYTLEGGIESEALQLDTEKLYIASKLSGGPREQLTKAQHLTRSDLKLERNDEQPHEGVFDTYCSVCWVSKQNHS